MFGLSKIDDAAVRYRVNIEMDIDPASEHMPPGQVHVPGKALAQRGAKPIPPGEAGVGRWYRGDLHAHSEHSDGANTVEEIVEYTRRIGLDYFALTDHNTISHWDELARLNDRAPLLIPGEEITMYGGHANVWGLDDWIDFRGSDSERVQQLVEDANRARIDVLDQPPRFADPVEARRRAQLPGRGGVERAMALVQRAGAAALGRAPEARRAHDRRRRQRLALRATGEDDAAERPRASRVRGCTSRAR